MDELFDARRTMLIDEQRPVCDRRVVSLVSALRAVVGPSGTHPGGDAGDPQAILVAAREVLRELDRRGIDGETLVRFGLMPEIVASVTVLLLPRWLAEAKAGPGEVVSSASLEARAIAWHEALPELHIPPELPTNFGTLERGQDVEQLVASLAMRLIPWALAAPLDDLLTLAPPETRVVTAASMPPEVAVMEEYRWMVERFSETRLQDWATASLHLEHRWLRGSHPAPCSEQAMADRLVAQSDLNDEIAVRATQPKNEDSPLGVMGLGSALTGRMFGQAMALLRQGRFSEAATLFRFASRENKTDAVAANNLGFCLIPDDPREALEHLTRAQQLGFASKLINVHNRATCLFLLGDPRLALRLISDAWAGAGEEQHTAVLWRISDEGVPLLSELAPVRDELVRLAVRCALTLGDLRAAEFWKSQMRA